MSTPANTEEPAIWYSVSALVVVHLAMAAVDYPGSRDDPEHWRAYRVGAVLLILSLVLALLTASNHQPVSIWKLIEAVFGPIGTRLFKPEVG